jgi:F-type H+-transporting ATPase subunit delta
MLYSKVSNRYAHSLFLLALERGVEETVYSDMKLIDSVYQSNRDFVVMLRSPIIKADKKQQILKAIFGNKINLLTAEFLYLLTRKRRENYIGDIAHSFIDLYLGNKGIQRALLQTAFPVDDEIRKMAHELVFKNYGTKIELKEEVKPEIIGGYIIRVGDVQADTSISTKLRRLRRVFTENPFVKDF